MSASRMALRATRHCWNPLFRAIGMASLAAVCISWTACNQVLSNSAPASSSLASNLTAKIMVNPARATLQSQGSLLFRAVLRGSSEPDVQWEASAGSILSNGLFVAPSVRSPQVVTVTAFSLGRPWARSVAVVTVVTPLAIETPSLADAVAGTQYDVSLQASGGKPPYQWAVSGALPAGLQLDSSAGVISGLPVQAGSFPFSIQVTDSANLSATQTVALLVDSPNNEAPFDGPAELPRVYLSSSLADTPAPGNVIFVGAGQNFQDALNRANCGDTIQLQAGAVFSGMFLFPAKACDDQHWIIVRTSSDDSLLPPEGTRLTPCYAGVASLPARPAFNCASVQNVMAQIVYGGKAGDGPIHLAAGANHYRLLGLEVTRLAGGKLGHLIAPQSGTTADHIVLDRVWLHGTAQDETKGGIQLSGTTNVAVVDSFFTDFHCIALSGECTDAQAIGGGTGNKPSGPYKIVNNFLEASGEVILFGGGAATVAPADIEIRRNHFFKPMTWLPGTPGFVGGADGNPFIVKNHFELKNAQRVLFEANILENNWGGFSQHGQAILLTPKNQHTPTGNVCPLCQVTDVTIRYSTISHVGGGLEMSTSISGDGVDGGVAQAGGRYSIHDITINDVSASKYHGGGGLLNVGNSWGANGLNNVVINHITGFGDPGRHLLTVEDNVALPQIAGFTFTNNIVGASRYPVWSAGGGPSNCAFSDIPMEVFSRCFNPYSFTHNAIVATPASTPASAWPADNYFPSGTAAAGLIEPNGQPHANYQLAPSSPYKNAGTDGKDLGADMATLQTMLSGVY